MSSKTLEELFEATIEALNPEPMLHAQLGAIEAEYVTVLALGKAAVAMTLGAQAALGSRIRHEVVVAPAVPTESPDTWIASSHPLITQDSERAGNLLLAAASAARDPIIALLSGGGSALAAVAAPGLALADKRSLLVALAQAGAPIEELNVVRSHLSALKGGRLSLVAQVPVATYVISDVVGDRLATVASGPTLPDGSTYQQALAVVHRCLGDGARGKAVDHLRRGLRGEIAETPQEPRPDDKAVLVAGVGESVKRCGELATADGEVVHELGRALVGDVEDLCRHIVATASAPGLWIGAGEPTVTLPPKHGSGGRAQHLALLLARAIRGRVGIRALVAGTDGVDGNSSAAGAVVDSSTWQRILRAGIDPARALTIRDSGTALGAVGALLNTGPTGVNHADLVLLKID